MMKEDKNKCFVILPFSQTSEEHTQEYWDNHYTYLKQLIESNHSLKAERSSALRGDIVRQIITDLISADIIIADLTDLNPNVTWELGVRQSFKHCSVTIAEHTTKLPFDLHAKGTLWYYPKDHTKMPRFEGKFNKAINDCLENPELPDSHVLETISGRGTVYQIITKAETIRKLNALVSEIKNNKELLNEIERTCKRNKERRRDKKGAQYVTGRFHCPAIELLIISRYVDVDNEFYENAEKYFDSLLRLNDQLSIWESYEKATESWFLKYLEGYNLRIDKFQKLLKDSLKAIEMVL